MSALNARAYVNEDKLYRQHQAELVGAALPPLSAACNFAPPLAHLPSEHTRSAIAGASPTSSCGGASGRPNTNTMAPGEGPVAVLGGALAGAPAKAPSPSSAGRSRAPFRAVLLTHWTH